MPQYFVTDMPAPFIAGKPTPGAGKMIELSARDAAYEVRRGLIAPVAVYRDPPPLFVLPPFVEEKRLDEAPPAEEGQAVNEEPPVDPVPFSKRRRK